MNEILQNKDEESLQEKIKLMRDEIKPNLINIKRDIKRLMNDGIALRESVNNLKWTDKENAKLYESYKIKIKPDEEQKEIAAQSAKIFRKLRKSLINSKSGNSRNILWQKKKEIGVRARHLQLLYAMLRGKKRLMAEDTHINYSHLPSISIFLDLLEEFVPNNKLITISDISDWLDVPSPPKHFAPEFKIKLDGKPFLSNFLSQENPDVVGVPIIEKTIEIICSSSKLK